MLKTFALFCTILCAFSVEPPISAAQYEVHFNQTAQTGSIKGTTRGTIYYDATNNRQVITRQNGYADRFCGNAGAVMNLTNTPCNHIVVQGKRFLDFPKKNYCCFCCDAQHGCGIVTRDWIKTSNYTYLGLQTLSGQSFMKWEINGLQDNYYYHKNDTLNTPRRLFQIPNDLQDFYGYKLGISDASIFKLPSYCTDKCGPTTFCAKFRSNQMRTSQI